LTGDGRDEQRQVMSWLQRQSTSLTRNLT